MPRKRIAPLNEEQVIHAMCIDDAYQVERVLADKRHSMTELVTIEGSGPFIRKRIPAKLANRGVWAALAACESPRLPRVIATYDTPDQFVVVCDYAPGDTFEHVMATRKRLAPDEAVTLVAELCEAVCDLNARGIAHCDVNPTNVVVAADGAHLIDLGIAQVIGQSASRNAAPLGTWGFAAPEQYGFAQVDARTDVYAIARMLGYALCGVRPDGEDYEATLADERIVPPALCAIARKGAAFEPSARFQSAAEFAEAARQALASTTASAQPQAQSMPAATPAYGGPTAVPTQSAPAAAGFSPTVPHPHATSCAQPAPAAPSSANPQAKRKHHLAGGICIAAIILACVICGAIWIFDPAQIIRDTGRTNQPASPGQTSEEANQVPANSDDATSNSPSSTETLSVASFASIPTENVDVSGPLTLIESGCSADSMGYVHYAFGLRNTSTEHAIDLPGVKIVGRKADGTILFSEDMYLFSIQPGQTLYYGGQAGKGTPPDSVTFTTQAPEEFNITNAADEPPAFRVDNVKEVADDIGLRYFSGEVTFLGGARPRFGGSDVAVSIILRDASNAIIYGDTAYASFPAEGETTTFETLFGELPAYAKVETCAQSW